MDLISDSIKQGQASRSQTFRQVKQIILGVVAAGLLILNWWLLKQALFGSQPASFWAWPIAFMAVWTAVFSLFALVNTNKVTFFIVNAIGLIVFLYLMPRDIYIFLGGLIFFLLNMLFHRQMQGETVNQLNFSIRRTVGNSQGIITYGILILIGFMVYSNVRADFMRNPDQFYQKLAETAVKGIPYLSQDQSKFNLGQSVGDFFRNQAEEQYPEFNQVSSQQQQALLNDIRDNFTRQFGLSANENSSLKVALTQVVTERIRDSLGRYERFFPLFFTIAVIALLKTVAFVFNWVVLFLAWLFYRILLATRFFRIIKQPVEVEKLEI